MSEFSKPKNKSGFFNRFWKPVAATGAGGTAFAIWFEEILIFATDFIGVILLPILSAIIYFFNHFLFKSFELKGEDHK